MNPSRRKMFRLGMGLLVLGLSLLASTPVLADPDTNTLLTNPLNRHNMSNWATHGGVQAAMTDGTDQICIFCHTPHAAEPVDGPLWNRTQPIGSFFLYGGTLVISETYSGSPAGSQDRAQYGPSYGDSPNGASRLCMSCHDGVTAIGVGLLREGGDIAMDGTNLDDGSLLDSLGSVIDLSTSHPISFIYSASVLSDIITARGAGTYQLPTTSVNTPLDSQSRMQCTTCHDPHYDTSLTNGSLPPFWHQTTTVWLDPYTDVCSNCHIAAPGSMTPIHP